MGLTIVEASRRRIKVHAQNDFTQNDEDNALSDEEDDLVLSKSTFVMEDAKKLKVEPEAEKLAGQDLVDYVNRRQDLWTVSGLRNYCICYVFNQEK